MMKLAIYEVLQKAAKAPEREDKLKILRDNFSPTLGKILHMIYHSDKHEWRLTKRKYVYKPNENHNAYGFLYHQFRVVSNHFVMPGSSLSDEKLEKVYIQFLESIHAKDAEMFEKHIRPGKGIKGLSKTLVDEAYGPTEQ